MQNVFEYGLNAINNTSKWKYEWYEGFEFVSCGTVHCIAFINVY